MKSGVVCLAPAVMINSLGCFRFRLHFSVGQNVGRCFSHGLNNSGLVSVFGNVKKASGKIYDPSDRDDSGSWFTLDLVIITVVFRIFK